MAAFTVKFDIENDAFKPTPENEIARILRSLVDRVQNVECGPILDNNGNRIGEFKITGRRRRASKH